MTIAVHKFRVEGISSLLMNNPSSMAGGGGTPKLGVKHIPTPEIEAASKVYRNDGKELVMPSIAFRSSLLRGCVGKKIGKTGAATKVAGGVFAIEPMTPLIDPQTSEPITEYRVHVTRCVVQRNGVIRGRPEIPKWAAEILFEVDTDFIEPDQVRELLSIAGRIAGVGDWRPEKRGPHGRYKVI